jgi:hypothetical protein
MPKSVTPQAAEQHLKPFRRVDSRNKNLRFPVLFFNVLHAQYSCQCKQLVSHAACGQKPTKAFAALQ